MNTRSFEEITNGLGELSEGQSISNSESEELIAAFVQSISNTSSLCQQHLDDAEKDSLPMTEDIKKQLDEKKEALDEVVKRANRVRGYADFQLKYTKMLNGNMVTTLKIVNADLTNFYQTLTQQFPLASVQQPLSLPKYEDEEPIQQPTAIEELPIATVDADLAVQPPHPLANLTALITQGEAILGDPEKKPKGALLLYKDYSELVELEKKLNSARQCVKSYEQKNKNAKEEKKLKKQADRYAIKELPELINKATAAMNKLYNQYTDEAGFRDKAYIEFRFYLHDVRIHNYLVNLNSKLREIFLEENELPTQPIQEEPNLLAMTKTATAYEISEELSTRRKIAEEFVSKNNTIKDEINYKYHPSKIGARLDKKLQTVLDKLSKVPVSSDQAREFERTTILNLINYWKDQKKNNPDIYNPLIESQKIEVHTDDIKVNVVRVGNKSFSGNILSSFEKSNQKRLDNLDETLKLFANINALEQRADTLLLQPLMDAKMDLNTYLSGAETLLGPTRPSIGIVSDAIGIALFDRKTCSNLNKIDSLVSTIKKHLEEVEELTKLVKQPSTEKIEELTNKTRDYTENLKDLVVKAYNEANQHLYPDTRQEIRQYNAREIQVAFATNCAQELHKLTDSLAIIQPRQVATLEPLFQNDNAYTAYSIKRKLAPKQSEQESIISHQRAMWDKNSDLLISRITLYTDLFSELTNSGKLLDENQPLPQGITAAERKSLITDIDNWLGNSLAEGEQESEEDKKNRKVYGHISEFLQNINKTLKAPPVLLTDNQYQAFEISRTGMTEKLYEIDGFFKRAEDLKNRVKQFSDKYRKALEQQELNQTLAQLKKTYDANKTKIENSERFYAFCDKIMPSLELNSPKRAAPLSLVDPTTQSDYQRALKKQRTELEKFALYDEKIKMLGAMLHYPDSIQTIIASLQQEIDQLQQAEFEKSASEVQAENEAVATYETLAKQKEEFVKGKALFDEIQTLFLAGSDNADKDEQAYSDLAVNLNNFLPHYIKYSVTREKNLVGNLKTFLQSAPNILGSEELRPKVKKSSLPTLFSKSEKPKPFYQQKYATFEFLETAMIEVKKYVAEIETAITQAEKERLTKEANHYLQTANKQLINADQDLKNLSTDADELTIKYNYQVSRSNFLNNCAEDLYQLYQADKDKNKPKLNRPKKQAQLNTKTFSPPANQNAYQINIWVEHELKFNREEKDADNVTYINTAWQQRYNYLSGQIASLSSSLNSLKQQNEISPENDGIPNERENERQALITSLTTFLGGEDEEGFEEIPISTELADFYTISIEMTKCTDPISGQLTQAAFTAQQQLQDKLLKKIQALGKLTTTVDALKERIALFNQAKTTADTPPVIPPKPAKQLQPSPPKQPVVTKTPVIPSPPAATLVTTNPPATTTTIPSTAEAATGTTPPPVPTSDHSPVTRDTSAATSSSEVAKKHKKRRVKSHASGAPIVLDSKEAILSAIDKFETARMKTDTLLNEVAAKLNEIIKQDPAYLEYCNNDINEAYDAFDACFKILKPLSLVAKIKVAEINLQTDKINEQNNILEGYQALFSKLEIAQKHLREVCQSADEIEVGIAQKAIDAKFREMNRNLPTEKYNQELKQYAVLVEQAIQNKEKEIDKSLFDIKREITQLTNKCQEVFVTDPDIEKIYIAIKEVHAKKLKACQEQYKDKNNIKFKKVSLTIYQSSTKALKDAIATILETKEVKGAIATAEKLLAELKDDVFLNAKCRTEKLQIDTRMEDINNDQDLSLQSKKAALLVVLKNYNKTLVNLLREQQDKIERKNKHIQQAKQYNDLLKKLDIEDEDESLEDESLTESSDTSMTEEQTDTAAAWTTLSEQELVAFVQGQQKQLDSYREIWLGICDNVDSKVIQLINKVTTAQKLLDKFQEAKYLPTTEKPNPQTLLDSLKAYDLTTLKLNINDLKVNELNGWLSVKERVDHEEKQIADWEIQCLTLQKNVNAYEKSYQANIDKEQVILAWEEEKTKAILLLETLGELNKKFKVKGTFPQFKKLCLDDIREYKKLFDELTTLCEQDTKTLDAATVETNTEEVKEKLELLTACQDNLSKVIVAEKKYAKALKEREKWGKVSEAEKQLTEKTEETSLKIENYLTAMRTKILALRETTQSLANKDKNKYIKEVTNELNGLNTVITTITSERKKQLPKGSLRSIAKQTLDPIDEEARRAFQEGKPLSSQEINSLANKLAKRKMRIMPAKIHKRIKQAQKRVERVESKAKEQAKQSVSINTQIEEAMESFKNSIKDLGKIYQLREDMIKYHKDWYHADVTPTIRKQYAREMQKLIEYKKELTQFEQIYNGDRLSALLGKLSNRFAINEQRLPLMLRKDISAKQNLLNRIRRQDDIVGYLIAANQLNPRINDLLTTLKTLGKSSLTHNEKEDVERMKTKLKIMQQFFSSTEELPNGLRQHTNAFSEELTAFEIQVAALNNHVEEREHAARNISAISTQEKGSKETILQQLIKQNIKYSELIINLKNRIGILKSEKIKTVDKDKSNHDIQSISRILITLEKEKKWLDLLLTQLDGQRKYENLYVIFNESGREKKVILKKDGEERNIRNHHQNSFFASKQPNLAGYKSLPECLDYFNAKRLKLENEVVKHPFVMLKK